MKKNSTYWISRFFYALAVIAFIGVITGHPWHIATGLSMTLFGALLSAEWKDEIKTGGH